MILILRKLKINVKNSEDVVIGFLQQDTAESGYFSDWTRSFFQTYFNVTKSWIGIVSRSNKKFEIRRSSITIKGEIKEGVLEVAFGLSGFVLFNLIGVAIFLIFIGVMANDIWIAFILVLLVILNFLFVFVHLNKDERTFEEYIAKIIESNSSAQ